MPKYHSMPYKHGTATKIGVLITNLGTPEAPTTKALRTYLGEFLADPRIVEAPRILWRLVLHGIILRTRPKKSAEAYKSIWTEKGSPLRLYTESQTEKLRTRLEKQFGSEVITAYAMRYGQPSISAAIQSLQAAQVTHLFILPLYPQYSCSTTGSTMDAISKALNKTRFVPSLHFLGSYHDHPNYIDALCQQIKSHQTQHGRPDKLIFSFHGTPLDYLKKGDPYHCQCLKTARLTAEQLGLEKSDYMVTFQSRFGPKKWLQPYTDETLKKLAKEGAQHVQVICPGFSSDCLETLEEIEVENMEYFVENGGKTFSYIKALNDSEIHLDLLQKLVNPLCEYWSKERSAVMDDKTLITQGELYDSLKNQSYYQ